MAPDELEKFYAERDRWQEVAKDIMQHFRDEQSNITDTHVALVMSQAFRRRERLQPTDTEES